MGYYFSNQHAKEGLDPNIHVIDGIYGIKGRSTLHFLVANFTKKREIQQRSMHRSYGTSC